MESTYLTGYVWAENIGWIKLGVDAGGPYDNDASDNWGVNLDGSGNLSGYAWSENAGWIKFDATGGGVSIDPATGKFDGYAWGENIGWIHFQNAGPQYYVQTDPLAKYYKCISDGDWSTTSIWKTSATVEGPYSTEATEAPTASNSAGIIIDDNIFVTVATGGFSVDQMTVNPVASLIIGSGQTLTIANGEGTDLTVQGDLTNEGTLTCADGSTVTFSGAADSTLSGSGTWTFKTVTVNKDASGTELTFDTGSDVTIDTALTVTRGTVDLDQWAHDLKLGGALDIASDGRWTSQRNNDYHLWFYGDACTSNNASDGGPQNLGHIKVD